MKTKSPGDNWICVGEESSVGEGASVKFEFNREGVNYEGVAVRWKGKLAVYENRCMHLPLSLDSEDNQFFTKDREHLICRTHHALYNPASGLCIAGPCEGATLKKLEFLVVKGELWVNPEPLLPG